MKSNLSHLRGLLGLVLLAPSVAFSAGYTWDNVAIGGGGFVSAIVASPVEQGLFYARTDVGGAYRWDESAKKWIAMTDWVDIGERGLLGIEAIAVDPKKPGKVYMVTGTVYWNADETTEGRGRSAFLRSSDYGKTWETIYTWNESTKWFSAHGNGMGRGNGEALAIDPDNTDILFYGSKNKGLWKSTDNGRTWKHVDGFTAAAGHDTTWNGSGFSFVSFAPGSSTTLYAGFLRTGENVFQSTDGGATWKALPIPASLMTTAGGAVVRLMPQRMVATTPDTALYVTFSDGAGPHTMAWEESWGMVHDGFGRGAVLKYSAATKTWTDVSPEDNIDAGASAASKYDNLDVAAKTYEYIAPYGGISINPADPLEMVVSTEGYTGAQFWKLPGGTWKDQWGSNIFHTTDGGETWVKSFQYYWLEGGQSPAVEQMDENGIGWLFNSSIHWAGSITMDPFDPKRVFVTSGNGVYMTENIRDYTFTPASCGWCSDETAQRQVWKVASHGIEEVVPEEVVSIPGGPLISIIGDYDGYRHDDVTQYPAHRHLTSVGGTAMSLGSTRALAFAPESGRLVKVADARSAQNSPYTKVPISPLQFSSDSGRTWTVATYESLDTSYAKAASVALSTDGAVALWVPGAKNGQGGSWPVFRYANSAWTPVAGIDGAWVLGDPEDANTFYAFRNWDGDVYRSTDKGITFEKVGTPGKSWFRKMRATPATKGDLWVPVAAEGTAGGLMRSKDGGVTWTAIAGVGRCEAVGFGKAAEGKTFPAIFVFAVVGGVEGVFQSDDEGATWMRVNDDAHEYGGLANGEFVVGDMNTYGVVYMSTAGRGIVYGKYDPSIPSRTAPKLRSGISIRRAGEALVLRTGGRSDLRFEIVDVRGRQLRQAALSGEETRVSLSGLAKGIFLVRVVSGSKVEAVEKLLRN